MRIFSELSKSYKTQEMAITKARQTLDRAAAISLDDLRWMMVVTENGRYQVCISPRHGSDDFNLVHLGFCVIG
jgi:hypothetical protein